MIVDVFHDTVCPWCRIGKRHLDNALAEWDGEPVTVRWRPFFLDETVPSEGLDFRSYFAERKGLADPEPIFARVRQAGAAVGLDFRFDRVRYATNTLLSHRLIALAPSERQSAVIDAIHRAYFEEGRNIGEIGTLADLAAEAGLDRETIADLLRGDAARDAVLAEAAWARDQGVTGVPLFVLPGRLALSGAQPAHMLLAALREAAVPAPARV